MKYIFGKSESAMRLEELVSDDPYILAKTVRHMSDYNNYVKNVLKMPCDKAKIKALTVGLDCNLKVSKEIKSFIRNLKIARRRNAIEEIDNEKRLCH